MYSTPVHSDFSLPQLIELLSDGHDAKLIMTLTRVLTFYILILRTARQWCSHTRAWGVTNHWTEVDWTGLDSQKRQKYVNKPLEAN